MEIWIFVAIEDINTLLIKKKRDNNTSMDIQDCQTYTL